MKPFQNVPPKQLSKIYAFDTEDDSCGNVISYAFCWFGKNNKIERFFTKSGEEARNFVRKMPKSIVFAHNLEYDLINLYRDVGFSEIEEMSYTARIVSAKVKGKKLRFLDSYNFFPAPLKKMGEIIGLKKLDFAPDSQEYAERDPEIVLRFMTDFQKKLFNDFELDLSNTIGSLAMKIFIRHYLKQEFVPFNDQIALDAFYGGRCEVFYKGELEGEIHEADINSEYPTVMTYEFPDTNFMREVKNLKCRFGVADVTVQAPEDLFVPVLPKKIEGKLIFPVGRFRGVWTFAEIKAAKERGYKVLKFHKGYGTDKGCFPFRKYMEEGYQRRLETTNELDKNFEKLRMNNLYGRLIQHNSRSLITYGMLTEDQIKELNARLQSVYGEIHIWEIPMTEPPETANYLWGAYVTSYGRLLLLPNLEKVAKNPECILAYCDTDSIIYKGPEAGLDLHETKLGGLKEKIWQYGNFVMPKGYILKVEENAKVTCKGVPQPNTLEKHLILTEENPRIRFLLQGRAEFRKPVKLRQGLVQDKKQNVWEIVEKRKRSVKEKRDIVNGNSGKTMPIVLEE